MDQPKEIPRPLSGLALGISISEAEDLPERGFTPADVNLVTVELCRRLIALGARVNLGHQWRPGGIMEAVAQFARTYQEDRTGPIINNFLAWPDLAGLSSLDRLQLARLVRIYEGDTMRPKMEGSRAAMLTEMRLQMVSASNGLIILSGRLRSSKQAQSAEFVPGIVEETALMLRAPAPKPVYLSKIMGGVASLLVDAITTRQVPARVLHAEQYVSPGCIGYIEGIAQFGAQNLAVLCGLTNDQLQELFAAENLDTVVRLTALGMGVGAQGNQ